MDPLQHLLACEEHSCAQSAGSMLLQCAHAAQGRVCTPAWLPALLPVLPPDHIRLQTSVHATWSCSDLRCSKRPALPSASKCRNAGAPPRATSASAEQATAEPETAAATAAEAEETVDDVLDGVEDQRRADFCFRLAVALAGCAFESYSSPAIDGRELAPAAVSGNPDPVRVSVGVSGDAADEGEAPSVLSQVGVNGTESTYVSV